MVKVVDSQFGRVIADKRGEAFYLFDKEKGKKSRCLRRLRRGLAARPDQGQAARRQGGRQGPPWNHATAQREASVTYAGHPLYYYEHDEPGTILCHNVDEFGGLWLVVDRDGHAVG